MLFLQALQGVVSILLMVSTGYILAWRGWLTEDTKQLFARLVNYVALPTYMTWYLMTTFSREKLLQLLPGMLVPFLSMLLCYAVSYVFSLVLRIPVGRQGTFRAMFFVSSAIFTGLPVNVALFGDDSIPYVLLYFLANAILFWTLGVYSIASDGTMANAPFFSTTSLKNFLSPPLVAFSIATACVLLELRLPVFLAQSFKNLGGMTIPLSMLFIGLTIYGAGLRKVRMTKDMAVLLVGRFIISPVAVLVIAHFFPIPALMKKVFVIQAAMPAMTNTAILAKVYSADPEYAAVMTSVTTLVSMLAIPVYMVLL